tara:strand:+ start:2136 stop:4025 length:1890 start_codon:yes stop_codon:yes gene_type:complete
MATTIQSTDLDFDTIKTRLKDYFKRQSEFNDYDFEASGLSNILDVLSYNTHFNGLIANFALNESFLNTAQLRSSIISHAEALGYVPRSYTSAQAKLNISISISATNRPNLVTLPRNTQFTTSIDNVSYTFQTRENYTATPNVAGVYNFTDQDGNTEIPVYEGTERVKTFFVGDTSDAQIYVIPDITIDTTTIRVRVFDTATSSTFDTYTNINTASRITSTSTHYQIKEVPNGYYEIIFGDGISTGKAPVAGNKIIIDYLSTKGPAANGAGVFATTAQVESQNVSALTNSAAAGGSFKEGVESIRQNAPIYFTSQRRMVTAEDYRGQILTNFNSFVDDVTTWGGADNDPPVYGRVYVSLKFKDTVDAATQQNVKSRIISELTSNFAIATIDTIYVDPVETFLELATTFNFNPDLTSRTSGATQDLIQQSIDTFFSNNLNRFGAVFRRSNLLTIIDGLDEAILNTRMAVKVQQRLNPVLNIVRTYNLNYPVELASPSSVEPIITSSRFTYNGKQCSLRNKSSSNTMQVVNVAGGIEVDNIGSYNAAAGRVDLVGFRPTAIVGSAIKVSAIPANQSTIRPLRASILNIDSEISKANSVLDYQQTQVSLGGTTTTTTSTASTSSSTSSSSSGY